MKIIGIDPGLSGAIAILNNKVLNVFDMPVMSEGKKNKDINSALLSNLIKENIGNAEVIVVEQVNAMPGQGNQYV